MSSTDQDVEEISDSAGSSKLGTPVHLPRDNGGQEGKTTEEELVRLFKPVLIDLEEAVQGVASSQVMLRQELDQVLLAMKELKERTDDDSMTQLLEDKSKKLLALKRRLTLVHTIVQTCNERTKKLISSHKITS